MRGWTSRAPRRVRAWEGKVESLEARTCLSVAVQFDYSLDSLGFFNDPARRDLLQRAADTIASRTDDRLLAIVPGGGNTWTATATNPATGVGLTVSNLVVPANTLIIYAGARPLSGSTLGIGGPGGYSGSGSQGWLDSLEGRGQPGALATPPTDQGPWGGSIAFDSDSSWYFGVDPTGLTSSKADFLSVATHELGHVFGFGMNVWQGLVSGGVFRGPASTAAYAHSGTGPPVTGSHWTQGLTSDGQEVSMDPSLALGQRKLLTRLDFAALQDIGWQVASDADGTRAAARDATIPAGAARTFDAEALDNQTDVDLFRFTAKSQDVLNAGTFAVSGGIPVDTYLRLFDTSGKELKAANSGLYDGLSYTFATDGTYYLGVSAVPNRFYSTSASPSRLLAGPTGNYALSLALNQDVSAPPPPPPPPPSPPPPLPGPQPVTLADTTPPYVVLAQVSSIVVRANPRSRPQRVAVIFVTLSEPLDPGRASLTGSFLLFTGRNIRGRGLVFDRRTAIQRVSYLPGATSVMLVPPRGFSLRQPHQLIIPQAAGLRDQAGNLLDGDRDGQPGGDFLARV